MYNVQWSEPNGGWHTIKNVVSDSYHPVHPVRVFITDEGVRWELPLTCIIEIGKERTEEIERREAEANKAIPKRKKK